MKNYQKKRKNYLEVTQLYVTFVAGNGESSPTDRDHQTDLTLQYHDIGSHTGKQSVMQAATHITRSLKNI